MDYRRGFLGSFLSKGLKTNQLEVNTDEKTLRPIARLKEPRELFALPKEKEYECAQQAPRWPIECQVIEERIRLTPNVSATPEPYYQRTGNELKPRPVGEENGIIVFNYNPISAVNYDKEKKVLNNQHDNDDDSSDSDISSCDSGEALSKPQPTNTFAKILNTLAAKSSSTSNDDDDDDDDNDDDNDDSDTNADDDAIRNMVNVQNVPIDHIKLNKSSHHVAAKSISHKKQQALGKQKTKSKKKLTKSLLKCKGIRNIVPPIKLDEKLLASKLDIKSVRSSSSSSSISTNSDELTDDGEIDGNEDYIYEIEELAKSKPSILFSESADAKLNKTLYINKNNVNVLKESGQHPNTNPDPNLNMHRLIPNSNANPSIATITGDILLTCPYLSIMQSKFCSNDDNSSNETPHSAPTTTTNNNANNSAQNHTNNAQEKIKTFHPSQFSRSAVNGSKIITNCHPYNPSEYDGLEFESRFESGNLAKAVQITPTYYELYLRPDLYTSRSKQWYFFRVRRTKKNMIYRFSIVNLVKSNSLYNDGMRPLMYSTTDAKTVGVGWRRCGDNICYYCNEDESQTSNSEEELDNSSYTLTFNVEFPHDNDVIYFAHSYPYTYSDLQDYLIEMQTDPLKSKFCKLRLLCRTLAGNNVYYLTVTAPASSDEVNRRKKSIVISARVHPSETPSSWMMKGLMDFITADTAVAKRLRHRFIFKIIPMLNPDGVIVGNTRNSLTGKDLNRQYRTVIRETYPSIWYTKALIKRLIDENGVSMYCDMHAHSRCHNIFIYGCENKRNPEKKLTEQVFPLMLHKNASDKFSFENCKFKIQRSKEGTGRIVVWMLGITNSYTLEASFGGSTLGSRKGTHFNIADYEQMGRAFCETLLDYTDDNPIKVKRQTKLLKLIKKIRKREKRERKALKLKKLSEQQCLRLKIIERLLKEGSSAEEPINIALTDYSSDEGSCSSSDEGKSFTDIEGPCCLPLKTPPCTPDTQVEMKSFEKLRLLRLKRMRKVMKELDRIYFQPLFHKKARFLMKKKPIPHKSKHKRKTKKVHNNRSQKDVTLVTPRSKNNNNDQMKIKESKINNNYEEPNLKITSLGDGDNADNHQCSDNLKSIRMNEDIINNNELSQSLTEKCDVINTAIIEIMPNQGLKGGRDLKYLSKTRNRIKVPRKLRLWLARRQIIIMRRHSPRKIKLQLKNIRLLRNSKKDFRRFLDIPTTDPGSDLIFSTDDEYFIDNNNNSMNTSCNTLPRIRRNLLQSDLQRRYIEEIGDGCRRMPPELIITSPTNDLNVKYTITSELNSKTNLQYGNFVDETARRTLSWHSLQAENLLQSSKSKHLSNMLHVFDFKNESLRKDDLNIQLSLKKKIWTGRQATDVNQSVTDRTRPLTRLTTSATTENKKIRSSAKLYHHTEYFNSSGIMAKKNAVQDKSGITQSPVPFLNTCSRKLVQWQMTNTSKHNIATAGIRRKRKSPLREAMPNMEETRAIRIFRQLINNQRITKNIGKSTSENYGNERKSKTRRNLPAKLFDNKDKSHTSMLSINVESNKKLPHIRTRSGSKLKLNSTHIMTTETDRTNQSKNSLNRVKSKNNIKKLKKRTTSIRRLNDTNPPTATSKQASCNQIESTTTFVEPIRDSTSSIRKVKMKLKKLM